MTADDTSLGIYIRAETKEEYARVKDVVSDHLERFAVKDGLKADWREPPQSTSKTSLGKIS